MSTRNEKMIKKRELRKLFNETISVTMTVTVEKYLDIDTDEFIDYLSDEIEKSKIEKYLIDFISENDYHFPDISFDNYYIEKASIYDEYYLNHISI